MARPWLWIPAGLAHRLSPLALQVCRRIKSPKVPQWSPLRWRNLEFKNPLGLAGGIDKDATLVQAWWTFGPGFIEIGTVTPKPQPGNSGHLIDRDLKQKAIWNRLGFPSKGMEFVAQQLERLPAPRLTPIFANIGKNATTPLERAHEDYLNCIERLHPLVDGFIINVSSPNTQGLRDLLKPENLERFLSSLVAAKQQLHSPPLLLKISPDLSDQDLAQILETSLKVGIDGWVLTNSSVGIRQGLRFPQEGGVSGQPLSTTAKHFLAQTVSHLGDRRKGHLLISVGGVITADDVFERLQMGADLVQVYSALILEGPSFFNKTAHQALRSRWS